MHHKVAFSVIAALMLAGCSSRPSVTYHFYDHEHLLAASEVRSQLDNAYFYQLSDELFVVSESNAAKPEDRRYTVEQSLIDAPDGLVIAMTPSSDDTSWVRTWIDATYRPNTSVLQTVGVDVEDRTYQNIQSIGAIARNAISLAGLIGGAPILGFDTESQEARPDFPVSFLASEILASEACGSSGCGFLAQSNMPDRTTTTDDAPRLAGLTPTAGEDTFLELTSNSRIQISVGPLPPTAIPIGELRSAIPETEATHLLIMPACRTMAIRVLARLGTSAHVTTTNPERLANETSGRSASSGAPRTGTRTATDTSGTGTGTTGTGTTGTGTTSPGTDTNRPVGSPGTSNSTLAAGEIHITRVPDSRYVTFISMPRDGSVNFHSSCGADIDVKPENNLRGPIQMLEELTNQLNQTAPSARGNRGNVSGN